MDSGKSSDVFSTYSSDNKIEAAVLGHSLVLEGWNKNLKMDRRQRRNKWITIVASLGVLVVILMLIAWPLFFYTTAVGISRSLPKQTILLEDIVDDKYEPNYFNNTWVSDTQFTYYRKQSREIILYDVTTMSSSSLLHNTTIFPDYYGGATTSRDLKFLLLKSNKTYIYDLDTQTRMQVINSIDKNETESLQKHVWSPRGNAFVYVYLNKIYYRPTASEDTEFVVTSSDNSEIFFKVALDEIFMENFGSLAFSKNGSMLSFVTYNDSWVMDYPVFMFEEAGNNVTRYPEVIMRKRPMVGGKTPTFTIYVVNLTDLSKDNLKAIIIPVPEDISDPVISAVTWANDEEIAVVLSNTMLNNTRIIICNCSLILDCNEIWRREEKEGHTMDFVTPLFSKDGSHMLFVLPHEQDGDNGEFLHLTLLVRNQTGNHIVALTSGLFTVTGILAWDRDTNTVYFRGPLESDHATQHVFSVSGDPANSPHVVDCVSCNRHTSGSEVECQWNWAYFSKRFSYYLYNCIGPEVPEIAIYNRDHVFLKMWEDNQAVRESLMNKAKPRVLRLQVPVPGGHMAQVQLWLPPDLDLQTKYPLVVEVYAGPNSNKISSFYNIDWKYYLTTNKSMVVALIDGRGSAAEGNKMRFAGHKRLGTVEIEDQLSITKYLMRKFSYLDAERTAIFGASYGGYATLMALAKDTEDIFKCGIAWAPVTDWRYYSSRWTEPHMGLPTTEDNLLGYQLSDVNDKVENFRNKKLFLIHGTADKIVNVQHTMMLARLLQKKNILFRSQIYPNEGHALWGIRKHLYFSMLQFLEDCFTRR